MASDPEIAALLASERHAEAFETLAGAYQHKVFRLAYSMLGDHASAEDAARATAPLEEAGTRIADSPPQPSGDVLRLVSQLPEKQRQVVMLYYMEDRSYEEVARLLDLPMGTVKTHLHRARKQLATMMKEADHAVRRA